MGSKQFSLRLGWALDDLATEMAVHLGYPNKTAFIKSLIRYSATVHRSVPHKVTAEQSKLSAAAQDDLDKELLRKWRAGETTHRQLIVAATQNVLRRFKTVPEGFEDQFIAELRKEIGRVMEDPNQGTYPYERILSARA